MDVYVFFKPIIWRSSKATIFDAHSNIALLIHSCFGFTSAVLSYWQLVYHPRCQLTREKLWGRRSISFLLVNKIVSRALTNQRQRFVVSTNQIRNPNKLVFPRLATVGDCFLVFPRLATVLVSPRHLVPVVSSSFVKSSFRWFVALFDRPLKKCKPGC